MFDPVSFNVAETLNDGCKVVIRAQRRQDREALLLAMSRASDRTLYYRFLGVKRHFSKQEEHFFLDIDYFDHIALVAEVIENGGFAIVGGCRYVVVQPGRAEVAFTVIDAYQQKGLGAALMRHLAGIGREAGLKELEAEVLSDNAPMMKVFKRSGLIMTVQREGPVSHVSLRYKDAIPEIEANAGSIPTSRALTCRQSGMLRNAWLPFDRGLRCPVELARRRLSTA